ncbi:AP-4 complex accessory subunit Tepsin isoform X2 [Latimeria chalumnae]|uniref:AP-4 complex accessory subunit Tepsin isoform X2 n=1 Tax=Latimeria chalumnae TaxID=7897 RepID=UPI00313D6DF8
MLKERGVPGSRSCCCCCCSWWGWGTWGRWQQCNMAALIDRLSFLQQLPMLIKATSDDEVPCPGYLFEEIAKISHESVGNCQCLLEYLLERLQSNSGYVKLKVLKILHSLCSHGSAQFVLDLRRNASFVQETMVFSGAPDPVHGNALFQKVRNVAQDLASILFSDALMPQPDGSPSRLLPNTGMGSKSVSSTSMEGFGYTADRSSSGSAGGRFLTTIQKAAEVVVSAVLPSHEVPISHGKSLCGDIYQPVTAPSATVACPAPENTAPVSARNVRAALHQPGQAGGGWEDCDSGHSSQNSSQENCDISRTSDGSNKSGSDGHSGASRESEDFIERVEAINFSDCTQEVTLLNSLIQGSKVFLTREETQHFVKKCALLNCEVVVELLNQKLKTPVDNIRMRSMCAISALMYSDLLSHDQIFSITQQHLQQLSDGEPGPVANKATKILRQFEALMRSSPVSKIQSTEAGWSSSGENPSPCTDNLLRPQAREGTGLQLLNLLSESFEPENHTCSLILLPDSAALTTQDPADTGSEVQGQSSQEVRQPTSTSRLVGATLVLTDSAEQVEVTSSCATETKAAHREHRPEISESRECQRGGELSLFAGMELVVRDKASATIKTPADAVAEEHPSGGQDEPSLPLHCKGDSTAVRQTSSNRVEADAQTCGQTSAFSFLNM